MDPKLQKLVDGQVDIPTLSDADLDWYIAAAARRFAQIDPGEAGNPSDEVLGEMDKLAAAAEWLAEERSGRQAKADERAAKAAALRSRITGEPDQPETADDGQGDGDGTAQAGQAEPAGADAKDGKAEPAKEPVTAGAARKPSRADLAKHRTPPPLPARDGLVAGGALVAAAGLMAIGAGEAIDWHRLAEQMARKIEMSGRSDTPDQILCAALQWEYPDERRLADDDPWETSERLDDIFSVDSVMRRVRDRGYLGRDGLIAAGGVCDPVPVDYTIPVQSVTERPVRDALPAFQATRGGIRFITPPTFAGVAASATTIWTSAIDATATTATPKPVQEFTCPTTTQELVDAIPTRVQFSNMQGRFAPEIVAANTQLALANAARVAEQNLLAKISARSTITGAGNLYSFTRDLFALLELLAQGYRYRNRLPDLFPLRVLMPAWAKGAMRVDILRESAHAPGYAPEDDPMAMGDSRIEEMFGVRGLIPNYSLDGLAKSVAGTTLSAAGTPYDWPDQFFGAQASGALSASPADASANSAVAGTWWPRRLSFFLFAEGTFVFLDGGRIDLGVIRDSVLNNLNKYQTFVEPFEGIAKRGYESIQCTVPVILDGVTQIALDKSWAASGSAVPAY